MSKVIRIDTRDCPVRVVVHDRRGKEEHYQISAGSKKFGAYMHKAPPPPKPSAEIHPPKK